MAIFNFGSGKWDHEEKPKKKKAKKKPTKDTASVVEFWNESDDDKRHAKYSKTGKKKLEAVDWIDSDGNYHEIDFKTGKEKITKKKK